MKAKHRIMREVLKELMEPWSDKDPRPCIQTQPLETEEEIQTAWDNEEDGIKYEDSRGIKRDYLSDFFSDYEDSVLLTESSYRGYCEKTVVSTLKDGAIVGWTHCYGGGKHYEGPDCCEILKTARTYKVSERTVVIKDYEEID